MDSHSLKYHNYHDYYNEQENPAQKSRKEKFSILQTTMELTAKAKHGIKFKYINIAAYTLRMNECIMQMQMQ